MKNLSKKLTALVLVCCLSGASAFLLKEKQVKENQMYVGIGYLAAKKGASPGACAIIGAAGCVESCIQGAAWGAAFGGPVGFGVALGVGL